MFELTAENAAEYLRYRDAVGSGSVHVTELDDGVSNLVLRIESEGPPFILKQSRPKLRTRDAWFSDLDRIWRECDAMRFLGPLLPEGVVPGILFEDRPNYAFAMTHAPRPLRNWRAVLLSGEVDQSLGERAGRILGMMHRRSAEAETLSRFADRTIFEQLRVEPFYLRLQQRLPDIAPRLQPLIDRCRSISLGLCHGDFSPKNLLLHAAGFTLVDYETAHDGDITFDLGFFVSHLLLKSIHRPHQRDEYHNLVRAFFDGYLNETTSSAPAVAVAVGLRHAGACLLARIDGASPAPYLKGEAVRDQVRRLGRDLLHHEPQSVEDMLTLACQAH